MAFLRIQVQGQPAFEAKIQGLSEALDTRKILDEGAALLYNRMRTRFLQEKDPLGIPWPKSRAAERRARTGRGGGTLFNTGRLFRSLQLFGGSATTREMGTNATSPSGFPYPAKHQFGIGTVMRQFLGFGDEDVGLMSKMIIRRIFVGLAK